MLEHTPLDDWAARFTAPLPDMHTAILRAPGTGSVPVLVIAGRVRAVCGNCNGRYWPTSPAWISRVFEAWREGTVSPRQQVHTCGSRIKEPVFARLPIPPAAEGTEVAAMLEQQAEIFTRETADLLIQSRLDLVVEPTAARLAVDLDDAVRRRPNPPADNDDPKAKRVYAERRRDWALTWLTGSATVPGVWELEGVLQAWAPLDCPVEALSGQAGPWSFRNLEGGAAAVVVGEDDLGRVPMIVAPPTYRSVRRHPSAE